MSHVLGIEFKSSLKDNISFLCENTNNYLQ